MGCYINITNSLKKEAWLAEHGLPPDSEEQFRDFTERPAGMLPVVLVRNPTFYAAAVAYSPEELAVFVDPTDPRDKRYYYVELLHLYNISPLQQYVDLYVRYHGRKPYAEA